MIVITGPGRSGTSFLARLYLELGFDPGGAWDRKIRAGFEEAETVEVNTEICRALRAPMGSPPGVPPGEQRWDLVAELAQRHGPRLHEIAAARDVVKDPRFCWTLRVWLEAGAPIEHVVVSLRPIDDVIGSAERAGMIDAATTDEQRNMMRSVRMYRVGSVLSAVGDHEVPHIIMWFPAFLDDPSRLHESLVFPRPVDLATFVGAFERVLDRDLVHIERP